MRSWVVLICVLAVAKCEVGTTEEYDGEEDAAEVLSLDDVFKMLVEKLKEMLMPRAYKIVFSSKASLRCLFDFGNVYNSVNRMAPWALKMIDASGKPSSGMLEGTSSALGDFDECLNVQSIGRRPFIGQYCLLEMKPPDPVLQAMKDFQTNKYHRNNSSSILAHTKSFLGFLRKVRTNPDHVIFRLGVCLPSTCTLEGIQSVIDLSTEDYDIPITVKHCTNKTSYEIEPHHIVIMSLLSGTGASIIICTIVSVYRNNKTSPQISSPKRPKSGSGGEGEEPTVTVEPDFWSKLSLCTSSKKLLVSSSEGDASEVTRGMKVVTVIFAIFTHTYALPHPLHMYRYRDSLNFVKFIDQLMFASVANSSVGADSFFFLTGFYFVFNRWSLFKRPSTFVYIAKFLALTYCRMIALQLLVGSLFFLLPVFGSGPLWEEFVEEPLRNCKYYWWMNLLSIQNNLGPYDICLYQSWILATMLQILVITSVLVYIISRWPLYGIICNISTISISMFAIATVTALLNYPATFTVYFYDYRTSIDMWKYFYTQFYTHLGPHCIGMLTAYLISEYPSIKFEKRMYLPLWVISAVSMASVVFGLYGYRNGDEMERGLAVFYAAVHRQAWAVALGWIVYGCATGHGGLINSVLSCKVFIPFEKLCYLAYLLHVPLMYYQGGTQRERIFMGHFNQIMSFISYTVVSFGLALVCYLLFQAPYEALEGMIVKGWNGNIWAEKSVTDSQITLKNVETNSTTASNEDNSKVLYNRSESERF